MKLFKLFLAGIISMVVNIQALSLPASLMQPEAQVSPSAHIASTNQFSRNWSGYAATGETFTGASATWQIPQSQTGNFGIDATWVGVGGVNTNDLIQAGTQTIVDEDGQSSYEAFYEVLPNPSQPIDIAVHAQDSISASIIKKSGDNWQISIQDNTTGQSKQFMLPYTSSLTSADWIEEAPSGERNILPLDNFGTIHFSNAIAIENGKKVTLVQANAQAMHMGEGMGTVLAVASVIGSDGQSFSVSRTNASTNGSSVAYRLHIRGFGRAPFYFKGF